MAAVGVGGTAAAGEAGAIAGNIGRSQRDLVEIVFVFDAGLDFGSRTFRRKGGFFKDIFRQVVVIFKVV